MSSERSSRNPRADLSSEDDSFSSALNAGEEDEIIIVGYKLDPFRRLLLLIPCILTAGILALVYYWIPKFYIRSCYRICRLSEATKILIKGKYDQNFVKDIHNHGLSSSSGTRNEPVKQTDEENPATSQVFMEQRFPYSANHCRYFSFQKMKYLWNDRLKIFEKLRGLDRDIPSSLFFSLTGLTQDEQKQRSVLFGPNLIQVHITPLIQLLFKEVLTPFYIFQLFSCTLWYTDQYYYYASCIVLLSISSIVASLWQTRKIQRDLRNTIHSSALVNVFRGGEDNEISAIPSEDLVPGDMIELPRHGCIMQCDALLLEGNVIVNESMLTGESVPVTKTPLPNPTAAGQADLLYDIKQHARHTLYCGTHVIQSRYYEGHKVCAVVVRTGFSTLKGELVRSILYPKPVDFRFNRHTYAYVGVLAGLALVGFIYTFIVMIGEALPAWYIVKRALDFITIAIPPALPAAMTAGLVYAQVRLRKLEIYCISPRSINIAGAINCCVFDKTGTLTEDGLDMQEVVPAVDGAFSPPAFNAAQLEQDLLTIAMASCHSLTMIESRLTGDPLDLKMFEWTDWQLEEGAREEGNRFDELAPTVVHPRGSSPPPELTIGIVRQFPFASKMQRMSVVTRGLEDSTFSLFVKGAPEIIQSLCVEGVPDDFAEILQQFTARGYRVIAVGYRELPWNYVRVQRATREQLDSELRFLGLVVLENRLKPQAKPLLMALNEAHIRSVMATGDNIQTALSVARECRLVSPNEQVFVLDCDVAGNVRVNPSTLPDNDTPDASDALVAGRYVYGITGRAFEIIRRKYPSAFERVCVRGAVFARMSPEQKQQLIEELQRLGYIVGMCGDGANDCGALKAAHMGISLSEAEASVASPFTARQGDVRCVETVIREGRAALVTSFGVFKYMASYSLTQCASVLILYSIGCNLADFQFLFIDLPIITLLVFLASRTKAYSKLAKYPPASSLISPQPIASLLTQLTLVLIGQVLVFELCKTFPNYTVGKFDKIHSTEKYYKSSENTAIFCSSTFMYITQAFIFSKGKPYRKTILSNWVFLLFTVIMTGVCIFVTIYPPEFLATFLQLELEPQISFRAVFIAIGAVHFVLSWIFEDAVIENPCWRRRVANYRERRSKMPYRVLERELSEQTPVLDPNFDFPPLPSIPNYEAQSAMDETAALSSVSHNSSDFAQHSLDDQEELVEQSTTRV